MPTPEFIGWMGTRLADTIRRVNEVANGGVVWHQVLAGVVVVLAVSALVLAVALAWRMGVLSRARRFGVDVAGGVVEMVVVAGLIAAAVALLAAGSGDEFIVALAAVLATAACGGAWMVFFNVRDRAGAVHQVQLSAEIAAASGMIYPAPMGPAGPPRHPWETR